MKVLQFSFGKLLKLFEEISSLKMEKSMFTLYKPTQLHITQSFLSLVYVYGSTQSSDPVHLTFTRRGGASATCKSSLAYLSIYLHTIHEYIKTHIQPKLLKQCCFVLILLWLHEKKSDAKLFELKV